MREFLAKRRPSPAMAVAFVALLAALSGTAVALPGKNSVDSADIKNKQVKGKDLASNAVTSAKIKNNSITGADVLDDSLTGADINESSLGKVPSATNADSATTATSATSATSAADADKLDGKDSAEYVQKTELLWALVDGTGALVAGRGATAATRLGAGNFRVTFNRTVNTCVTTGTETDVTGGAGPLGSANRIVGTDNRNQADNTTVDVNTTDPGAAGVGPVDADPIVGDGFTLVVHC
jgi:hypothetical protein